MPRDWENPMLKPLFHPRDAKLFPPGRSFSSIRRKAAACSRNRRPTSMPGSMVSARPVSEAACIVPALRPKKAKACLSSPRTIYGRILQEERSHTGSRTTPVHLRPVALFRNVHPVRPRVESTSLRFGSLPSHRSEEMSPPDAPRTTTVTEVAIRRASIQPAACTST